MPEKNERMIAGLLREREGLASLGDTERVAQVDEQLAHYGHVEEKPEPRKQAPQGRSAQPKQQTQD